MNKTDTLSFSNFWVLLCTLFVLINSIGRKYLCSCPKVDSYFSGTPCGHNTLEGNWRTFLWCTRLSAQWALLENRCHSIQCRIIKVTKNVSNSLALEFSDSAPLIPKPLSQFHSRSFSTTNFHHSTFPLSKWLPSDRFLAARFLYAECVNAW